MTIRAAHYEEAVQRLMADPIVQAMAKGLAGVPQSALCHDTGTPRFQFMMGAIDEYLMRGGTQDLNHIGSLAEALLRILDGDRPNERSQP